jgi:D-alanine-D-alanine ligase
MLAGLQDRRFPGNPFLRQGSKQVRMTASETNPKERESDKPPGPGPEKASQQLATTNRPRWLVAVLANVKGETDLPADSPPDAGAEFDRSETIQAIRQAIEAAGHRTVFIPADSELPHAIKEIRPDICFNIAEGVRGDGREAQVPAALEMMGIPYTASQVVANAISLEKTLTKRLWRDANLPVTPFQEFLSVEDTLRRPGLHYPLFVKPSREGTGMGVDLGAVVQDEAELRERVAWVLETYRQPALVETFLPGREFTIGVLGRRDFPSFSRRPDLYGPDGFHRFPVLEIESHRSVTPGVYGYKAKSKDMWESGAPAYFCPADIPPKLDEQLQRLALRAHRAITALDVSRVDFRLDADGNPYLLEINTLPGLNPDISDLCIMSEAEGLPYEQLILEILDLAASRFGLLTD